ncbi:MAG: hypothetical protein JHC95_21370 [Solirubrobacteraceae bacterium]|nr:hypothetical protein [Solirubrobacteraceae bacterium]
MWRRSDLLHPATIISSIALFVALGGVTYAAATIGSSQLKTGAVTRQKIKNKAVSPSKLANGAVTNEKLANNAITPLKLRTNAVTLGKIADGAVPTASLANGAVTESKLGSGSVTGAKLGGGAVGTGAIADGSVGTADLANGAVTAAKLGTPVVEGTRQTVFETISPGTPKTLFTIAGFGKLEASCSAGATTVTYTNTATPTITSTFGITGGTTNHARATVAPNGTDATPALAAGATPSIATWQLAYTDTAGTDRIATTTLTVAASGTDCVVTGDAISG